LPLLIGGVGGVAYNELNKGSGLIKVGNAQQATRALICNWLDATKLALLLRGWGSLSQSANIWTPTVPQLHPSGMGLFCSDVAISPMGAPIRENQWEFARLDVTYTQGMQNQDTTFNNAPVDFLDEHLELSADYASLGKTGWTFDDDSSAVTDAVQVLVPQVAYTITQYHVTKLLLSNIFPLMGCINLSTFRGAAAGKVLYLGCTADRKIVGNFANLTYFDWTIVHKFLVSPRSFLAETNPATGVITGISGAGGSKKYATADFSVLRIGASMSYTLFGIG